MTKSKDIKIYILFLNFIQVFMNNAQSIICFLFGVMSFPGVRKGQPCQQKKEIKLITNTKNITNTPLPPQKKIQIAIVPLPSVQQLAVCDNGIISQMGLLDQISNTLLEFGKSNQKLENRANVYILNQKNPTSIPDFVTNFFINAYQT